LFKHQVLLTLILYFIGDKFERTLILFASDCRYWFLILSSCAWWL